MPQKISILGTDVRREQRVLYLLKASRAKCADPMIEIN